MRSLLVPYVIPVPVLAHLKVLVNIVWKAQFV
jgi:hypothetical protein